MRRSFRRWMMAGALAAAAVPARAEEPVWRNPIAASNTLTVPPPAAARETKAVVTVAPTQKSIALPGAASVTAYAPPPAPKPVVVAPPVAPPAARPVVAAPVVAAPPAPRPAVAPLVRPPVAPPPTTAVMAPPPPVTWSAPRSGRVESGLPPIERPMVPCEPANVSSPEPPRPGVTTSAAKLTATPEAVKPLPTCRLCDPGDAKPSAANDAIFAVVRRAGGAPVRPTDSDELRRAVAAACREFGGSVEIQDLGDKQIKVTVGVPSTRDWALLYARLQGLPELGDYGLVVRVTVGK